MKVENTFIITRVNDEIAYRIDDIDFPAVDYPGRGYLNFNVHTMCAIPSLASAIEVLRQAP